MVCCSCGLDGFFHCPVLVLLLKFGYFIGFLSYDDVVAALNFFNCIALSTLLQTLSPVVDL